MTYLEYLKNYDYFDKFLLFLDELGFSGDEIATMTGVTRQTLHNAKKRNETFLGALKMLTGPQKEYGDPNINKIIGAFTESFGTTKSSKYDRWAAKRLSDKHGVEPMITIIQLLASRRGDQYRPSVNSVSELERKWDSVASYLGRQIEANNMQEVREL